MSGRDPSFGMPEMHDQCVRNLTELTQLVRTGRLTSVQQKSVVALVTIDVHNRDIVHALQADGVSSRDDFRWQVGGVNTVRVLSARSRLINSPDRTSFWWLQSQT